MKYFTMAELTHTQHRDFANKPNSEVVANLELLCVDLDIIRSAFGPMHVSSGYRCAALNAMVGGAMNSSHLYGLAADLIPLEVGVDEIMCWLRAGTMQFDQAINEKGKSPINWLHYSISKTPRRQMLIMRNGRYSPWSEENG